MKISDSAFVLLFHSIFTLVAAASLGVCFKYNKDLDFTIGALVVGYSVAYVIFTRSKRRSLYKDWLFSAILSLFMILPDSFLC